MIKNCARCDKQFDGHANAKYCPDCKKIVQHEHQRRHYATHHVSPVKVCPRCQKEFSGRGKYCLDCRDDVRRETQRECHRRWLATQRVEKPANKPVGKARTKPVAKPVEKLRPLTKADLLQLMKLIREAYYAGELILTFGGQSALTGEQLAVVEQKYPEHRQILGDQRNQKFFDAADKFIEFYQAFK